MIGRRRGPRTGRRSLMTQYADTLGNAVVRHRADLALKAANVEADLTSRARAAFIANMSHELRTPLNAIIGFSDVLRNLGGDSRSETRIEEYYELIHTSAIDLLEMINRLLQLTKIHSGSVRIDHETVDIAELAEICAAEFKERASRSGIRIQCELPDDSCIAWADQPKVLEILRCLVDNAVKFSGDGKIVRISVKQAASGRIAFTIADHGIGMSPGEIELATSRFGQVDSDLNRNHDGAGLGLPIAKSLTEIQGGVLTIESRSGEGTEVTVTLPASGPGKDAIQNQTSARIA